MQLNVNLGIIYNCNTITTASLYISKDSLFAIHVKNNFQIKLFNSKEYGIVKFI